MRPEKSLLLKEIQQKIESSSAMVIASYKHMSPNLAAQFRSQVEKNGGSFEVVKKRLLVQAAKMLGVSLDRATLQGHIGVVFASQDPVQATKYIYHFSKENDDLLDVLGGRFEGALCSARDVKLISELPSKDEMRAQLLGTLEAPMSQTLAVVESLLCSVIFCLDNKSTGDKE